MVSLNILLISVLLLGRPATFVCVCYKKRNADRFKQENINEIQGNHVETLNNEIDFLYIGSINLKQIQEIGEVTTQWRTSLFVNNKEINFKIDSGAMVNILPYKLFKLTGLADGMIKSTSTVLNSYTGDKLNVMGVCQISCKHENSMNQHLLNFYVINSDTEPLLGLESSINLNLISRINSIGPNNPYTEIIEQYKDVFNGIGCLETPYQIKLNENAKPVVHATRKVALPLLQPLKESLDDLEKSGIIQKVQGPSDWVNALVLVRKPTGKLRICLDPRDLNQAIKREYCKIPSLDQITSKLQNAKLFSTLDATQGFYHIPLDDVSSNMCTFGTPFGRYKFLRHPYGIKSAPEVFQTRFKSIFDLEGVDVYIDDIFIWGSTKEEHDERLKKVLQLAREKNIKLNLQKCKFGKTEVKYLGHIISSEGIRPDETKITAIMNMPHPTNKHDVQRLLGLLTYVSKFVNNFSVKTTILRQLLRKNIVFEWSAEHQKAFDEIKNILTKQPVLQFYDVKKETVVSVDASKSGCGAVLLQDNLPCAYASMAFTDTQCGYAQIEKELLAIVVGMEKFYQFVFGRRVTVETDHQPLINIFKRPLSKCPARLQRMLLQLQKYDINLKYKPGKELIIADTLSRAYIDDDSKFELCNNVTEYVCMIVSEINISQKKWLQFQDETDKDKELQLLKKVIQEGWPNNNKSISEPLKKYIQYKSELTIIDDLIFKGKAIVVPKSLQNEMLEKMHYNHLGFQKCLSVAKQSLFWISMTSDLKQKIINCPICLKYAKSQQSEPLISHDIPLIPWNKVGCDLLELQGKKYLLIIDYYSKYIELEFLGGNTTSAHVINKMKGIFARHGIPLTVVSDGGPQFSSSEFREFASKWEFNHIITSPTNSQSNGMAERNV